MSSEDVKEVQEKVAGAVSEDKPKSKDFMLSVKEPENLQLILKAINKIDDGPCFKLTESGLSYRGMDAAHVSLLDVKISEDAFEGLPQEKGETLFSFFGVGKLMAFLKRGGKDDLLTLTLKKGKLRFDVQSEFTRQFTLPTSDPHYSTLKLPKVDYTNTARITTEAFEKMLGDAMIISDEKLVLEAKNNQLVISSSSYEGLKVESTLSASDIQVLESKLTPDAKSCYNPKIISDIVIPLSKFSAIVGLSFGADLPLKIHFETAESPFEVNFYLAPRIEDD